MKIDKEPVTEVSEGKSLLKIHVVFQDTSKAQMLVLHCDEVGFSLKF